MNTRTAMLTGAGGFLGRYIARDLHGAGWRVIGVDREGIPRVKTAESGLADLCVMELPSAELDGLLDRISPGVIVHAAGPASVPASVADPSADYCASVGTLQGVLESIRRTGSPSRVLFLSSAAVYGEPSRLPVVENAAIAPVSPYGYHKFMGETLLAEYASVYGVRGCSVRIFSAYGPGLRRQVLWDVSRMIQSGSVLRLLGTGAETRDFVHAADVARGVRVVLERGSFRAEVYNLATGLETHIVDLARMLAEAFGRNPRIEFSGARRTGDPTRWRASIGCLAGLGYVPEVPLQEGVAEYAKWFLKTSGEG